MHALLLRIAVLGPVWLYHPLGNCTGTPAERTRCLSYNFWSGIGSDLAYIATIGGAVLVGWRSYMHWRKLHECQEEGCKLIGTFHLPSGARACLSTTRTWTPVQSQSAGCYTSCTWSTSTICGRQSTPDQQTPTHKRQLAVTQDVRQQAAAPGRHRQIRSRAPSEWVG